MSGPIIHCPTPEEEQQEEAAFFAMMRLMASERRAACENALRALSRLCVVMQDRSGQPYKVRSILFSLWNGKPAQVNDLLNLDWEIRKDLCAVLLAFGYEDAHVEFFYNALRDAVRKAGQWEWFIEESQNLEILEEYVKASKAGNSVTVLPRRDA